MPIFRVEFNITFNSRTEDFVEYYMDEARKNPEEKDKYLSRAKELSEEKEPSIEEIYDFLSSNNYNDESQPKRYISLASSILNHKYVYNIVLSIKNDNVILSFMVNSKTEFKTPLDIQEFMYDFPFEDTYYEGAVGNELRFPSRKDSTDLLGELRLDLTTICYVE